jgi:hypothetical protein
MKINVSLKGKRMRNARRKSRFDIDRWIRKLIIINVIVFSIVLPVSGFVVRERQAATMAFATLTSVAEASNQSKIVPPQLPALKPRVASLTQKAVPIAPIRYGKISEAQALMILPKIAECESGNDPLARNPTSSAKGLLQIVDGTWNSFACTGNVLDRDDNFRCGMKIATESGLHHWNPSRACWIKKIPDNALATL